MSGLVTGNAHSLTLNTGGTTKLQGGASGLTTLTTDLGGTTELQGTIAGSGPRTYNDAVLLKATTTLDTSAGSRCSVSFTNSLDSDARCRAERI